MNKLRGAFELCNARFYRRFDIAIFHKRNYEKSVVNLVEDIAFQRDEILGNCLWAGQSINCDHFKPVMTSEAICYSFNILNSRDILSNK